jgi:hypothetical protein
VAIDTKLETCQSDEVRVVSTCRRRQRRDLSRADVVVATALLNTVGEWPRKDDVAS